MLANIITSSRIIAAVAMLLAPASSPLFWILYVWCGVSDMIDGPLARKTGGAGQRGAMLDSAADIAFALVCFIKILPLLQLEPWFVIWIAVIVLIKLICAGLRYASTQELGFAHSTLNKLTGLAVFLTIPGAVFLCSILITIPACTLASITVILECFQLTQLSRLHRA